MSKTREEIVEDIKDIVKGYVAECETYAHAPLISSLARRLGVAGRRGLERLKKEYPEVSRHIDIFYAIVEEYYEGALARICAEGSQENAKSSYSAMFMLKSFGWKDDVSEDNIELVSAIQEALSKVVEEKKKLAIGVTNGDKTISMEVINATDIE